jgi:amidase
LFSPDRGDDPLVTEGVLTRTVADTAPLLDVLAGYERGDATWAPPPARPVREALWAPPKGLRVGLLLKPPVPADLDPTCARGAENAARLLEDLGHTSRPSTWNRLRSRNGRRSTTYGRCSRRRG